ncbi:MAG TPA: EamA family transporter, partial [Aquaticitalea sp.]|nr:EamA family transporter [Aquaticitalea sp.]
MTTNTKTLIYVLLCVLLWAMVPIVSKLGQEGLDNHQFLFWSSITSLLLFFGIGFYQNKFKRLNDISTVNYLKAIILGFLGTYFYYILLYYGY